MFEKLDYATAIVLRLKLDKYIFTPKYRQHPKKIQESKSPRSFSFNRKCRENISYFINYLQLKQ